MSARAIMVLGTSSHVGKSLLTAALCRIFVQQGYRVAPFKSQNMSLNSAATIEGLEIGRAQALQAEAAGVLASVHMNPILLKPSGNMSSQVIVRGKIWGQLTAADYHHRRVEELMPMVRESYEILAAQNDVIILEGAGSPAEINLKQHDIVNMRMAELADAACLLVGDIDRGGVFASLLGTVQLLDPSERTRIRGFLINKFRGDLSLLQPGIAMMEERLAKPCLGVVPYIPGLLLEEEDNLGFPHGDPPETAWQVDDPGRTLRIAVIAFPSFSNFTDFDSLRSEPSISLRFCREAGDLSRADVVILPGSKQTAADLLWMQKEGIENALLAYSALGLVVGVCGGMQMLGEHIADPFGVEHESSMRGLGLLPLRTEMQPRKITSITSGATLAPRLFGQAIPSLQLTGYEIHVGNSEILSGGQAFAQLHRAGQPQQPGFDGCVSADSRIFGTYLHGVFDEDGFRHAFISAARNFHGLQPAPVVDNWKRKRDDSLNRLADTVRASVDMQCLFGWAGLPYKPSSAPEGPSR
jgi:adenosylcobyric acid synthase